MVVLTMRKERYRLYLRNQKLSAKSIKYARPICWGRTLKHSLIEASCYLSLSQVGQGNRSQSVRYLITGFSKKKGWQFSSDWYEASAIYTMKKSLLALLVLFGAVLALMATSTSSASAKM